MGVMIVNLSAFLLGVMLVAPVSQPRPLVLEASINMWRMIGGQLQKYPEGQQLVRDVLGLPDPTPAPETTSGSSGPGAPVGSNQEVAAAGPSIAGGQDPVLPKQVEVEASQGHLSLQPVGVVLEAHKPVS